MKIQQKCFRKLVKLVLIGLALLTCLCNKDKPTALELIVKTVGTRRLTEARLSGGFSYGLLEIPTTNKEERTNFGLDPFLLTDNEQFRGDNYRKTNNRGDLFKEAKFIIYTNLNNNLDANNLHELGVIELLSGNYSSSIDYLEKALVQGLRNSRLLNDLAGAYLERGQQKKRSADLIKALDLIGEIRDLDKNDFLIEAKFNKALVLEKLCLVVNAQEAWKEYLSSETNADWKQEGQLHLAELEKEKMLSNWLKGKEKLVEAITIGDINTAQNIIKQFPYEARICVLEELIPGWASATEQKEETRTKIIKIITFIGQKIFELQGDKELLDRVNTIISIDKNIQKRSILANAYLHYIEGVKAFENYENEKAIELFEQAIKGFSQVDDKASKVWTIFQRARCDLVESEYQKVFESFNGIDNLVKNNTYLYLEGRILWSKGLIYGFQFDLSKALQFKQLALNIIGKMGDIAGSSKLNHLIASDLVFMGEEEEAWTYIHKSLILSSNTTDFTWRIGVFVILQKDIIRMGKLRVANYVYQEIKGEILKSNNETLKCSFLLEHSSINYKLGRIKEALTELDLAREHLAKISDPAHKKNTEQVFLLTESSYQIASKPEKAITTYNKVLEDVIEKDKLYVTQIYTSRAKAYQAIGNYDKAEADLKSGIEAFESQRSKITDERYRLSFFEEPQAVYEDMIKLQINQRQRLDVAFDYVELARSRALLDAIDGRAKAIKLDKRQDLQLEGTAKPFTLSQVQKALPKTVTLIRYLITKDKIFAWVIDKDKVNLVEQEINETQLEQQIFEMRKTIINFNSKPQEIESAIFPVYNAIFAKIKPLIKQNADQTLIIIPDKALYAVPFNALIDPETKRYLIEDFPLGSAPSATVYVRCLERDKQLSKNINEKVLAIGNPSFSQEHFKGMRYLSNAEKEAEAVSEIYSNTATKLLLTKDATKETFLKELSNYNVIHYAGHALVDPASPLFSKLLLAFPDNAPSSYDEAVYAHEIYGQQFNQTKLVILAACRTAGGQRTKGEGMISLARPFLAKGVPAVVASLWDADDKASLELFKTFHQERLAGKNSLVAMQKAQIKLLKSSYPLENHPRMWSLFQVIGGVNLN